MTSLWHRNSEPMWSKIASWTTHVGTSATLLAPSSLKIMYKNVLFQPHSGQTTVSMCSNALHCDFIAHMMLKSCKWHRTSDLMWSKIALAYASPCVYSDLAHIMLWVAGGNCPLDFHCNRYRGTRSDVKLVYTMT